MSAGISISPRLKLNFPRMGTRSLSFAFVLPILLTNDILHLYCFYIISLFYGRFLFVLNFVYLCVIWFPVDNKWKVVVFLTTPNNNNNRDCVFISDIYTKKEKQFYIVLLFLNSWTTNFIFKMTIEGGWELSGWVEELTLGWKGCVGESNRRSPPNYYIKDPPPSALEVSSLCQRLLLPK